MKTSWSPAPYYYYYFVLVPKKRKRHIAQPPIISPPSQCPLLLPPLSLSQNSIVKTLSLAISPPSPSPPLLRTSWFCSRKCRRNSMCKGLKKALEFDVQIQTEDCVMEKGKEWKEIKDLPWKGGQQERNPDYEVLHAELRKMVPINGRAVLLFRVRCGCPLAKLEAWGPKKGPRQNWRPGLGFWHFKSRW